MAFFQDPPRLGNQYDDDVFLRAYLRRVMPADALAALEGELRELGERSGGELYRFEQADRLNDPVLTQWDPWGNRIDHVEVSPLWKEAAVIAARHGLVATGYERKQGACSRVAQFALNYVVQPSLDVYSCPLAMTDGAAATLLALGNQALVERAIPRLTSRDPDVMWTSGQWMTERTGGSDVGLSETVARQSPEGWRLYGTKWFTSAVTSQMTLTLGRPEGNGPGGRGLALFYVEIRDAAGRLNHLSVNRLKDKLGTRKVPTAELTLDGTLATPVVGLDSGIKNITPMLTITRTWNAFGAAWGMRRAMALAQDFATRRVQFGAAIADKPLHVDTLAGMEAETRGATLMAFRATELLGKVELGEASEAEELTLRLVTPLAKLTTGKQAVAVTSEALECFGGAGYVEDTGVPKLLRDAQVLPIWEGTTNVLSLDVLRALKTDGTYQALAADIGGRLAAVRDPRLGRCVQAGQAALTRATDWLMSSLSEPTRLEAGARRFALTLGRTLQLSLLAEQAQWELDQGGDLAAVDTVRYARRFAAHGVDQIVDVD